MTYRSLLYLLAVLLVGCGGETPAASRPPSAEGHGTLFIIGGGSRPDAMIERMVVASGVRSGGHVVILPMASSAPEESAAAIEEQLTTHGATDVRTLIVGPDAPPTQEELTSIEAAALVYIPGGSQSRFMEAIAGTGVAEALHAAYRKGQMIAGTSAGAAVMSEAMITGDTRRYEEYHPTFRTIETDNIVLDGGLGFLRTAIIDQHFVYRSRHNRLLTAILEDPSITGIGIDESTAVLLEGSRAEVVGEGQVLVFTNPDRSARRQDGKFGARGLHLDIYLPGDTFTLDRTPIEELAP